MLPAAAIAIGVFSILLIANRAKKARVSFSLYALIIICLLIPHVFVLTQGGHLHKRMNVHELPLFMKLADLLVEPFLLVYFACLLHQLLPYDASTKMIFSSVSARVSASFNSGKKILHVLYIVVPIILCLAILFTEFSIQYKISARLGYTAIWLSSGMIWAKNSKIFADSESAHFNQIKKWIVILTSVFVSISILTILIRILPPGYEFNGASRNIIKFLRSPIFPGIGKSIFIILFCYFVLKIEPETGAIENHDTPETNNEAEINRDLLKTKYVKSSLKIEKKQQIADAAKAWIMRKEVYSNTEYSLQDLAKDLKIPSAYVSQSINDILQLTFTELLNVQRARNAAKLLQNKDFLIYSVSAIGRMAGFMTKSTYFRFFKREFGCTPLEFRNKVQNESGRP